MFSSQFCYYIIYLKSNFLAYSSVSFDKCLQLCDYHHKEITGMFHQCPIPSGLFLGTPSLSLWQQTRFLFYGFEISCK